MVTERSTKESMPESKSSIQTKPGNVVISCVKMAKDSNTL